MSKKMDDIIPPEHHGEHHEKVRRIPKPSLRSTRPRAKVGKVKRTMFGGIRPDDGTKSLSKNSRKALWGVAGIALVVLIFAVSTLFEHATLKITPKQRTVDLDFVFTAIKESVDPEKIPFQIVTIPLTQSVAIPATETKDVEQRASGTIVIYNNYEAVDRRLVKNTRFETPEGLIYRVYESVVVPRLTTENGKKVPGSIEVTVYADEPGEKYNRGLTDFTIPGFKNDPPRYEGFYARSKTAMTGGFIGKIKTVSEETENASREKLQSSVRSALLERVQSQKPEGFTLFNDGIFITFSRNETIEQADSKSNEVVIEEIGTLKGILFDTKILSQKLGMKIIPQLTEEEIVTISNLDELIFALLNKDSLDISEDTTISFSLSGRPHFVWVFDEALLIQSLLGHSKGDLKEILNSFPSITQAEVVIRPFWKRSFPEKASRFSIEQILGN